MVKATRETHSGMQHGNVQRQEQLGVSEELSQSSVAGAQCARMNRVQFWLQRIMFHDPLGPGVEDLACEALRLRKVSPD